MQMRMTYQARTSQSTQHDEFSNALWVGCWVKSEQKEEEKRKEEEKERSRKIKRPFFKQFFLYNFAGKKTLNIRGGGGD